MRAPNQMAMIAAACVFGGLLAGCGDNCQTTCSHIYDPSECGIIKAGVTPQRLINDCVKQCERALATPGDMGDYNPRQFVPASENVELQTDQQAATWIDCVWEVAPEKGPQDSCAQLDPRNGGICAPI